MHLEQGEGVRASGPDLGSTFGSKYGKVVGPQMGSGRKTHTAEIFASLIGLKFCVARMGAILRWGCKVPHSGCIHGSDRVRGSCLLDA